MIQPLKDLLIELQQPFVFVPALLRLQAEEQKVLLIEAQVDLLQVVQRADEQSRADQEQQRHRDLRNDQPFAQTRHRARGAAACLSAVVISCLVARHAGAKPNNTPVNSETASVKTQHSPIQTGLDAGRQNSRVFVGHRRERALAPERKQHADRAAQGREQHTFGQQLPDQTPTPRADRQSHIDLRAAQRRARQQQVRDVGAGNQQHQRHDAEQPIDRG